MKLCMKLVEVRRKARNGNMFSKYYLVSADGRWYGISCPKEIRDTFDDYKNKIVEIDADHVFTSKRYGDNGELYTDTKIAITKLVAPDLDSDIYKKFVETDERIKTETLNELMG